MANAKKDLAKFLPKDQVEMVLEDRDLKKNESTVEQRIYLGRSAEK
jgi:hypothetical protein